jgi:hypothetical protein
VEGVTTPTTTAAVELRPATRASRVETSRKARYRPAP